MKHICSFNTLAKTLVVSVSGMASLSSSAALKITEIMPSNLSTIVSDKYDYNGYVEIYNDGDQIDLNGWTVTNEKEGKTEWSLRLNQSHIIKKGYNLLFFAKDDVAETSSNTAGNVNQLFAGTVSQKLTSDEGKLILTNGSQTISIEYPKQYPHISYGDGGYMIPSPGVENKAASKIESRVASPKFSGTNPGVVYAGGNATVQLQCATDGAKIYYTLDGSIPTEERGTVYDSPIQINKTTIVRARAYKDGALYSNVVTGSYLFTDDIYSSCGNSRLPIVSICSDREHFYDDKVGICVRGTNGAQATCSSDQAQNANYYQSWLRPANFEYIIDGKVVDNQEVEVGVFGNCSRQHNVKSFKIKANKRTGNNKFQYTKFFADRSYTKYKALALRNGGNGFYLNSRWRDGYMQTLARGLNIDYQAYQPVGYFLNGEYKGLMGLRERTDEDYIYSNYGYDEDEIEYLRVNKDVGKYVAEIGTDEAYYKMENFAANNNGDADFYEKLSQMMDIDEYIDYQIIQQFMANTDWVNNNIKVWRKKDGGKFRWILFDMDFGLSTSSSASNNMLNYCINGSVADNTGNPGGMGGPGGFGGGMGDFGGMGGFGGGMGGFGGFGGMNMPGYADAKYCTLFKGCMQNEDFKYHFLDRYTYLLETRFTDNRLKTVCDSMAALVKEEECATIAAGKNIGSDTQQNYDAAIQNMLNFALQRPAIVERQLVAHYGVQSTKASVKVRVNFNGNAPEYCFLVNKIASTTDYSRDLFVGERVKVELRVPAGYKIQSWKINGETKNGAESSYLDNVPSSGMDIEVNLGLDSDFKLPKLYLNEVCASNNRTEDEYGAKPDWIEIYNAEDHDVDLAGMIIKNQTANISTAIPYDYSTTVVPAKGRVMIWADKSEASGPLHMGFKLSAEVAQRIQLILPYLGKEELIDEILYQLHDQNASYGRKNDGSSEMTVFDACSNNTVGKQIATPNVSNGTLVCSKELADVDDVLADELVYPNPTSSEWTINAEGEYTVSDMLGQVVETGVAYEGMMFGGDYQKGVYLLKIGDRIVKIIKK
ncbi:MAG: CotH kinase family protein [Paludibacteraceae bacterium]|nr:CotH kinase family protein [Paludibacteraceae bacterium]